MMVDDYFQPGDVVGGKYEIYRRLGVGGFGLVYLAYSRDTAEVVALKTFRTSFWATCQHANRSRERLWCG